ncbi:MAG: patatin-like phospholipase family protein [Clostridia bacterium]|nr:patatin-like phospholipase family protein [Clostridia bacterium]
MKKLKIGLALGGGGARGFAHLGAIKCFEENGIKFDYISGTSVGSLVGALYASGLNYQELYNIASKLTIKDIKKNKIFFMPDDTDGIEAIIEKNCPVQRVEELQTPTSIVAVDLISGNEVDITSGNLAKAVAGSCCVPSVFNPVIFEDMHLADGGLSNNIPSDICKKHNCDIVIAIDVNPTRGQGTESLKLFDVLAASLRIMMKSNSVKGEMYADCFIAPNLKKFSSMSNEGFEEMIQIGYNTTKEKIDEIKALINPYQPKLLDKVKNIFGKKSKKEINREKYEKNHQRN